MSKYLRFCPQCNMKDPNQEHVIRGRYSTYLDEDNYTCEVCNGNVIDTKILSSDYKIIVEVSNNPNFIKSMMELHDTDIVEYTAKMNQFKQQIGESKNTIHCPKCNSTSITTGARGVNWTFGLIGASKTINRCANCGHTWKP